MISRGLLQIKILIQHFRRRVWMRAGKGNSKCLRSRRRMIRGFFLRDFSLDFYLMGLRGDKKEWARITGERRERLWARERDRDEIRESQLTMCIKSTALSVTVDLFQPLDQPCVFEGMSHLTRACLPLGLLCIKVCVWEVQFLPCVCPHSVSTTRQAPLNICITCISSYS